LERGLQFTEVRRTPSTPLVVFEHPPTALVCAAAYIYGIREVLHERLQSKGYRRAFFS
jgi:hypothetical protein